MDYSPRAISVSENNPEIEIENVNQTIIIPDYNHPASTIDASSSVAPSTSTAVHLNSTNDDNYSVFINHRGPDVKHTLASHLYHRLNSHGCRTFLDQDELQHGINFGSQIRGAIQNALVHVAIFSANYAESKWCLDELHLMLESRAPIIPVFYNVKPADLKWTHDKDDGKYGQALHNLEEKKTETQEPRYDPATIERWRNALFRAGELTGFELKSFSGDEGKLVDGVVQGVWRKLKEKDLYVAKHATGLDKKVEDFKNTVLLQHQQSRKPQIVGIVGLGGVGKTTFATELFNRMRSNYNRSFFLSDVRENASKSPLQSLQSKLMKGLTQMDYQIGSVGEGISMLKEQFSFFTVLVVLDDVDHANQVDAFLPDQNVLKSDSLILITSRDKNVLTSTGVEESDIYKLTGLDTKHSRQLLCHHAFGKPCPPVGSRVPVDKYIEACDGLPLSLKVFGALLRGKNEQSWKDQLDRLQQILPHEIQKRLKISYDALHRDEQQIFLDIACFFIGKEKDTAIRIWEGSGWKGFLVFEYLESKCLVEVDSVNRIKMHDHLRDMGREIVKNSRLPLRFWRWTENIDDLLQQSYERSEVRGIRMLRDDNMDGDDDSPELSSYKRWSSELFWNSAMKLCSALHSKRYDGIGIRKLQLLDTEGDLLERILRRVQSPNLIWLSWRKCPYSSLPSWVPVENLKVLRVSGGVLKTLWPGKSQAPLQLQELGIVSPLSKLPKSIGQLKHLELIVLKDGRFKTLPDEFCQLESLKRFELSECSKLESLPDSFGELRNLKHLDLSYSKSLQTLPDSFGELTNLEHLDLSYSKSLQTLPDSFSNLTQLKYLNCYCCFDLTVSRETLRMIGPPPFLNISHCKQILSNASSSRPYR